MKKIDLTSLSWLKKDEEIQKTHKYKKEIFGIIFIYISAMIMRFDYIIGLSLLCVSSYLILD